MRCNHLARTCMAVWWCVCFLVAAGGGFAWAQNEPAAGVTFYASFDEDAQADRAEGDPNPTQDSNPGELVEGIIGKGITLEDEHLLRYAVPGNFDNARGTLSFCFKIEEPLKEKGDFWLFSEEGNVHRNMIRLQLFREDWFFNRIHWYVGAKPLPHKRMGTLTQRKPFGEWHHVLLTWDKDKDADFYIDGRLELRGKFSKRRNRPRGGVSKRESSASTFMTFGPPAKGRRLGGRVILDEVKVLDRMLSKEDAVTVFREYFPVNMTMVGRRAFERDVESSTTVRIKNVTDREAAFDVYPELGDATGDFFVKIRDGRRIQLKPGQESEWEIPIRISEPGDYILRMVCKGKTLCSRNFWICAYPEKKAQELAVQPALDLEPIKTFDCSKTYGPEEFCDDGLGRVIDTEHGKIRITSEDQPFSRFAYRFFVEKTHHPHVAEIEYPDDREFEMEIMIDNRGNDLYQNVERGLMVGGRFPNSNGMKTMRFLFWPYEKECTIMAMNWPVTCPGMTSYRGPEYGDKLGPAALKSIRIYEVNGGIPGVELAHLPPAEQQRTAGSQEEDASPTTRLYSGNLVWQIARFKEAHRYLKRRFSHMGFMGQNLYVAPTIHYSGAFHQSDILTESSGANQFPPYWHELALRLAEHYGIKVHSNVLLWRVDALEKAEDGTDLEDVIAGKDTLRNMRWDGKPGKIESAGTSHPEWNILHPDVQSLVFSVMNEIMGRFGTYPAFTGINVWMWSECPFWLGDLTDGYSDYNITLFEKETGVDVPGEAPDPDRFTRRYHFLTRTDRGVREQWIDWRCRKVGAFWRQLCERVSEKKPGTSVSFNCWNVISEYPTYENSLANVWKPGHDDSILNFQKRGGLDFSDLRKIPNLRIGPVIKPNMKLNLERGKGVDGQFSKALVNAFENEGRNCVWLEQKRREFDCMRGATLMPGYWLPEGVKSANYKAKPEAERVQRWIEKSAAIMPHGDYYLEYYANYLADWDVREFTDGGISAGTLGSEDVLRDFLRAYRTIPAEHFVRFKDVDDPVCVRHRGNHFYAVNREFYTVNVDIAFSGPGQGRLIDLAADEEIDVDNERVSLEIGPFRVRSFRMPAGFELAAVTCTVPPEKVAWLRDRMERVLAAHQEMGEENIFLPENVEQDVPWFIDSLKRAWAEKRYARVRKLLDSHWAQYIEFFTRSGEKGRTFAFFQARDYSKKFFAEPLKTYAITKVDAVPSIDSSAWYQIVPITDFSSIFTYSAGRCSLAKPTDEKTEVYACYTDQDIAFLFRCYDSRMAQVVPIKPWKEADVVKIMLAPNEKGKPYYYLRTNYENAASYNIKINPDGSTLPSEFKNELEYEASFVKKDGFWLGRFVIPFATLEQASAPAPDTRWRFNLARKIRNNPRGDALSAGPHYGDGKDWGFHDPACYDYLLFQ